MKALLYLILLAALGGSLFLFVNSRQAGDEDLTLIGLGGAAVSFVLLCLMVIVGKLKGRGKREDIQVTKA